MYYKYQIVNLINKLMYYTLKQEKWLMMMKQEKWLMMD